MDPISICCGLFVGILFITNQQVGVEKDKKKTVKAEEEVIKKKQQEQQQQLNSSSIKCPYCKQNIKVMY